MENGAQRVIIRGNVQGVGFRWATRAEANRLGVTGSVRNRSDGSVEVIVDGSGTSSLALLSWLNDGPPGATVSSVETDETRPTGGSTFEVLS